MDEDTTPKIVQGIDRREFLSYLGATSAASSLVSSGAMEISCCSR